jgi:hypothetical protein
MDDVRRNLKAAKELGMETIREHSVFFRISFGY